MKKKVSLLLLAVILVNLLSFGGVTTYAKSENISEALTLLNILDIVPAKAAEKLELGLSRADFAVYAANVVNADSDARNSKKYYDDVPQEHWAVNSINTLTEMGAFTVGEDKKFYPNRDITLNEAVKVMLHLAGYSVYSEARGGFPSGYMVVANERGILDGVKTTGEFTTKDAVMLIYNTVNIDMLEPYAAIGEAAKYKTDGNTLLSVYHEVYYKRAQVTGVYGITLTDAAAPRDNEVRLDDVLFGAANIDPTPHLGLCVDAYYKHDEKTGDEVVYIKPVAKKNDYIDIDSSDILRFDTSSYTIRYFEDDKEEAQRISYGAVILKNGKQVSDNVNTAMSSIEKGNVRLIDTDGDDAYDIVIINDYFDMVIGYIDDEKMIVYDEYDPAINVNLEESSSKAVLLYNKAGTRIDFKALALGDILTVFKSDNYIKAYQSTETIKGKIVEKTSDAEESTITIAAQFGDSKTTYKIDNEYVEKSGITPAIGMQATLKMDIYGAVAYIDLIESDMLYGYLMSYHSKTKFDSDLKLKILTDTGNILIFDCNERVKVDEKLETKAEDVLKAIRKSKAEGDETVNQLIRYSLDEENKIKAIDTVYSNGGNGSDKLFKTHGYETRRYTSRAVRFGTTAILGTNTLIFGIPKDEDFLTASDDEFAKLTSSFFFNSSSYGIEAYKTELDSGFEDVIIYKGSLQKAISTSTDMFVISHITNALNANGEIIEKVYGCTAGTMLSYHVAQEYSLKNNGFGSGDIVRLTTNHKGEISNAVYVYQYADGRDPNTNAWIEAESPTTNYWDNGVFKTISSASQWSTFTVVHANVVSTKDSVLKLSRTGYALENVDEMLKLPSSPVIVVYDKDAKDENSRISAGSLSDLVPGITAGSDASKVFVRLEETTVRWIVIYK